MAAGSWKLARWPRRRLVVRPVPELCGMRCRAVTVRARQARPHRELGLAKRLGWRMPFVVQRLRLPGTGRVSYTLLGEDGLPVGPAEQYLEHLEMRASPNTVQAYEHDLRDFFTWAGQGGLDWRAVSLEQVAYYFDWLRRPKAARAPGAASPLMSRGYHAVVTRRCDRNAISSTTSRGGIDEESLQGGDGLHRDRGLRRRVRPGGRSRDNGENPAGGAGHLALELHRRSEDEGDGPLVADVRESRTHLCGREQPERFAYASI